MNKVCVEVTVRYGPVFFLALLLELSRRKYPVNCAAVLSEAAQALGQYSLFEAYEQSVPQDLGKNLPSRLRRGICLGGCHNTVDFPFSCTGGPLRYP